MFNYGNMFERLQQMGGQGQFPPGLQEKLAMLQGGFGGMGGLQGLFNRFGQQQQGAPAQQAPAPQPPAPPVPPQSLTNFRLPSAPMAPQIQMPSFNMASAPIDVSDPSKAPGKRGIGRL